MILRRPRGLFFAIRNLWGAMGPSKGHVTSSYRTGLLEDVSISLDEFQFVGPQTSNHSSCRVDNLVRSDHRTGPIKPGRFGFCCRLMALGIIRPVQNSLFKL